MKTKIIYLAIFVSISPFLFLFTNADLVGGNLFVLANMLGLIGVVLMLWQFILGIRFISSKFEINYASINKVHKKLGKYGTLLVFFHPILQTYKYGTDIITSFFIKNQFDLHVMFGRVAFYLLLIIWITSALLRKKIKYRPWAYIHYLSYPTLFFAFLHAKDIGTFLQSVYYVSLYWNILVGIFFATIIFRLLNFFNFLKIKARLVRKANLTGDVGEYVFSVDRNIFKKTKPGQFFYLRFSFFGEAHPYSVMEFDEKNSTLSFGIKKVGKHSGGIVNLKTGKTVFLDGPYGKFTLNGQKSETSKIIIAGGIGITPFIEFVKRFYKNTVLFNSVKFRNGVIKRDLLNKLLGQNYIEIVTSENKKITKELILKKTSKAELSKANIYVCGPDGFMQYVEQILVEIGVDKNKIYKEEFTL